MSRSPERLRVHAFLASGQREPLRIEAIPFAMGLGMRVTSIDVAAGRLQADFNPGSEYVGGARDTVHGGAVATMLDLSLAYLMVALTGPDQGAATANLNVSYLRPLPQGPCSCEAQLDRQGRSMGFVHAVLWDASGARCATASATFSIFERN